MNVRPVIYRFHSLEDKRLVHGVTTRWGGYSQGVWRELNLGHTVGDAPQHVAHNHVLLFQHLGIRPQNVVTARQVHGNAVALVDASHGGQVIPGTDALVTNTPGIFLMLRYADCVPIFLYDPKAQAVALIHAGWKGTLGGVALRTVQTMVEALGCRPADLKAAIGPSIGPCCYEVGPEVVARFLAVFGNYPGLIARPRRDGGGYLNLWLVNAWQLRQAGLKQIETAFLCTACRTDLFFSHRGEGGNTGRLGAIIGLQPDDV